MQCKSNYYFLKLIREREFVSKCNQSSSFSNVYMKVRRSNFLPFFRHFNETGSRLASGSDDLEIIVWDWQKGKKVLSFKSGHTSNVFQSKFLPLSGDTLIATTSRDGQVRLAELSVTGSCRSTRRVASHKGK